MVVAAIRRLLKTETGRSLLASLATGYLRLLQRTVRWTVERPAAVDEMLDRGQPFIACFWHGRLATMRAAWPGQPAEFSMLISGHRDGALIARAMSRLGFDTVAGSSRRGGTAALLAMQEKLRSGRCVGITPDGPRGPRMRAKLGAIKAAQMSGVPIVPISGSARRCRVLKSWDRFCLVLPFASGEILFGEPLPVPKTAERAALDGLRLELERRLNDLTAEADRRCGQPGVTPAATQSAKSKRKVSHAGA